MARLNHRACSHPATNAGRTACRKAMGTNLTDAVARIDAHADAAERALSARDSRTSDEAHAEDAAYRGNVNHCTHCGSTDGEDTDVYRNQGYSLCCNEPISTICDDDCGHHA